jgi:hypothetical protein
MNEGYAFMGMVLLLGMSFAFARVASTWIRARHGYPLGACGKVHRTGLPPEDVTRRIDADLAARDATIARLEERVRVLERIVTVAPARLGAEIERLRDEPIARRANG